MNVQIQPALSTDKDFILSLTTRFSDFDLPEWWSASEVDSTSDPLLQKALDQPEPESGVFVAEAENDELTGFIHLETEADFFDGLFMPYMFYNSSQPVWRMLLTGLGPVLLLTGLPVILILFAPLAGSLRANLGFLVFFNVAIPEGDLIMFSGC